MSVATSIHAGRVEYQGSVARFRGWVGVTFPCGCRYCKGPDAQGIQRCEALLNDPADDTSIGWVEHAAPASFRLVDQGQERPGN